MFGLFKGKSAPREPNRRDVQDPSLHVQRPATSAKPRILASLLIAKERQPTRFNDPTSHF
ncbi:MAG: hypothetical protein JWR21_18 [Herminiimonas sp.]|nr:hypothetical protein [Herminiimonas sp.]